MIIIIIIINSYNNNNNNKLADATGVACGILFVYGGLGLGLALNPATPNPYQKPRAMCYINLVVHLFTLI